MTTPTRPKRASKRGKKPKPAGGMKYIPPFFEVYVRGIVREELGLIEKIKGEKIKGPSEPTAVEIETLAKVLFESLCPLGNWNATGYQHQHRRAAYAALAHLRSKP